MTLGNFFQTVRWGKTKAIIGWVGLLPIVWSVLVKVMPSLPGIPDNLVIIGASMLAALFFGEAFNFKFTEEQKKVLPLSLRVHQIFNYCFHWGLSVIIISLPFIKNQMQWYNVITYTFIVFISFGFVYQALKNASIHDRTYFIRLLILFAITMVSIYMGFPLQ